MLPPDLRTLPRADVTVTALGLGTAPIGGLYAPVDRRAAVATIRRALDAGLRQVDTAPLYGLGRAEELVGEALRGRSRADYVLSTKVGRLIRPLEPGEAAYAPEFVDLPPVTQRWDFSAEGVRASLAESLGRIGVDAVDLLLVHDPDEHEAPAVETGFPALRELREAGTVRAIGAGMNQAEMLTRFVRRVDLDVVLLAGRYTLLDQRGLDELLPLCHDVGVGVIVGGVYNSGLLADPRPGSRFDYQAAPAHVVERARALDAACAGYGVPLKAVALQFPFGHPAVVSVLVGARSPAELDENLAMLAHPVPAALWAELRDRGLLDRRVPLPDVD